MSRSLAHHFIRGLQQQKQRCQETCQRFQPLAAGQPPPKTTAVMPKKCTPSLAPPPPHPVSTLPSTPQIIIKRISRAPINHTRWQHRALYNNTNHTHTHIHTHTHACARTYTHTFSVGLGDGQGCEKQFRNNY